jgi:hypothetical protein
MKRSAQVALVLMGVTGTTATAAYMMPPRADCRVQPAPAAAPPPTQALPPGVTPKQPNPCGSSSSSRSYRSYHSWSNWGWHSDRYPGGTSTQRPSSSVSTALTSSGGRVSAVSSTSSSSSSSTARGGFGSTGHAMSGGSSGS